MHIVSVFETLSGEQESRIGVGDCKRAAVCAVSEAELARELALYRVRYKSL